MKLVTAEEAVRLIPDGATVIVGGSGAGHAVPQRFIDALEAVYRAEGRPRDLTTVRVVGIGDFAERGFSQLAMVKRPVTSQKGAVFALLDGTVTLIEIAEGLDPESDVIAHMGFRPAISPTLSHIDSAVFAAGTMGLLQRLTGENQ